jgi:Domain of unknown function (DUF543)
MHIQKSWVCWHAISHITCLRSRSYLFPIEYSLANIRRYFYSFQFYNPHILLLDTLQMQAESESSTIAAPIPSDQVIPQTIQEGFEKMVVQAGAGFVIGGMAGIVLARGGAAGARRVMAGFGAGVGLGSAWTRTSMDIEEILSSLPK